jgi:putative transcriptional regulator
MTSGPSLVGQLLIAMPSLADPNFARSVVLLGVHSDDDGAFGLIVNRPLDVALSDVLAQLEQRSALAELPQVLAGGPVEPSHGFVMFERDGGEGDDEHALFSDDAMVVSGSSAALAKLVEGRIRGRFYLLLGYAGWFPGQLEREIEENSWLVAPLDHRILFDVPLERRWTAALASIGVEPGTLVDTGTMTPS